MDGCMQRKEGGWGYECAVIPSCPSSVACLPNEVVVELPGNYRI